MPEFILPGNTTPQVSVDAADKVIAQLLDRQQAVDAYQEVTTLVGIAQPVLREFLFEDQPLLPPAVEGGINRRSEFYAGAMIACVAYLESGYDAPINENDLVLGQFEADLEGIPEAYLARFCADPQLNRIIQAFPAGLGLGTGLLKPEYEAALGNGAGWTRLVMQQTIAA